MKGREGKGRERARISNRRGEVKTRGKEEEGILTTNNTYLRKYS